MAKAGLIFTPVFLEHPLPIRHYFLEDASWREQESASGILSRASQGSPSIVLATVLAEAQQEEQMKTHRFSDRKKVRLSIRLNPLWWLGNDTEQTVHQADWYHRDWPEWRRSLGWALRNPLQNFRAFVIGVQDRNYEVEVVHGNLDPQVVQRNDVGEYGYQVIKLKFKYGVQLPFVSYSGKRVVWYAGWQPSGFFGLTLNLHSEREAKFSAKMES